MNSLAELSIKRPVLATVMSLVIVFAGIVSWLKLPIREYPDIDPPVVTVTTAYKGANSKVIETEITELLESEFAGVEGIRSMVSTSRDQVSSVVVEFNLERDINVAAQDLRDKISRLRSRLPDNAEEPVVAKADADARPIMWIRVQSQSRSLIDLAEYTDREIKDYFQNINGVSKVIFGGERRKSIQVLINPKKLAYYGLTVLDIEAALKANNIELPAGSVLSKNKEFSINVNAKLSQPEQYENLIVKASDSRIVRLRDLAQVLVGAEKDQSFVRFNGHKGFGLGIVRQAKSNTIKISDQAHQLVEQLKSKLPEDIELDVGYDAAKFIRLSLKELYQTIFVATLLVLLVIFLFLRNIRSTLIPGLAIPVSLIGVMSGLQASGFTLNLMTLLGLIIAIGIVVDDSIIVLENIYRYIEEGMEAKAAAKKGAEEITLAVVATTLVLIAIFLPIGFMTGITGRLLSEFAFSLCFATVISSFVALTVVPMLCSKVFGMVTSLRGTKTQGVESRSNPEANKDSGGFLDCFALWARNDGGVYQSIKLKLNQIFTNLESRYEKALHGTLQHSKKFFAIVFIVSIVLIAFLFTSLPKDFIPNEDRGSFLVIVQSPRGSNLDYLDRHIRKVENFLLKIPEVAITISVAAFGRDAPGKVTEGVIITRLDDWKDRARTVFAVVGPLFPQFAAMPEAFTLPIFPKSGPSNGFGKQPIQLVIKSNDLDFLVKLSAQVTARANSLKEILFSKSNLSLDKPELDINIKRDKALSLGVSMQEISKSLEILFAGVDVTEFNEEGENYKVIVRVPKQERNQIRQLGELAVRSQSGQLIQLANLIEVQESIGAEERSHHNRKTAVTIAASPSQGVTPTDGLEALERLTRQILAEQDSVPADLELDYLGASKEVKDADAALYFGFFVALVFAFLFLAGQFESFTLPVIIMITVPLALLGALLGLYLLNLFPALTQLLIGFGLPEWIKFVIPQFKNISLNIYSQIGMIMLIGMSTKNGILLVEFINQRGSSLKEIIEAAKLRLRPVLMTSISTILGLLPIALALGVGTESRQSLGVAIVFGMALSTLLTLFMIPCAYAIIKGLRHSEE